MSEQKLVILDHDGGHDDLIALALLLANPDKVKVIGCVVTDADCFAQHAFSATGKLMSMMHTCECSNIFPIAISSLKAVHEFPDEWRWSAQGMDDLPCLNIPANLTAWNELREQNLKLIGQELLAELVMSAPQKVTICVTGPLSNVAWCINKYGDAFCRNVQECVIMGGAIDVIGNVFINEQINGAAEWNIYWDPPSAKTVLTCPNMRSVLFSLDATSTVPVTPEVVHVFGTQNEFLLSQFAGSSWASCTHYGLMRPNDGYYAWDVLTAAYIINSNIADLEPEALDVHIEQDGNEGRTVKTMEHAAKTYVARDTKANVFYKMLYESMRRCRVSY